MTISKLRSTDSTLWRANYITLGLLLLLPSSSGQGYDFPGFFLPPLPTQQPSSTTITPCTTWPLIMPGIGNPPASSVDNLPSTVRQNLRPVNFVPTTTLRPVSIKMSTTTKIPSSGMVINWEPSATKRPSGAFQEESMQKKCFRTICKDWVQECHWFCDWIQTGAQQRRCMECLSLRGRHCFSCFQM